MKVALQFCSKLLVALKLALSHQLDLLPQRFTFVSGFLLLVSTVALPFVEAAAIVEVVAWSAAAGPLSGECAVAPAPGVLFTAAMGAVEVLLMIS